MTKKVKSKSYSSYMNLILAILVLLLLGSIIIWQITKNDHDDPNKQIQPSKNCKIIKSNQVCDADYIGLSESSALDKAKENKLRSRVVMRNGESLTINSDRDDNRLNFTIDKDRVSKVEFY